MTYGKIWFPVFVAFTLCAVVTYRRRRPAGFEKWAWRAGDHGAYAPPASAVFLDYWTQWTGDYDARLELPLLGRHLVSPSRRSG